MEKNRPPPPPDLHPLGSNNANPQQFVEPSREGMRRTMGNDYHYELSNTGYSTGPQQHAEPVVRNYGIQQPPAYEYRYGNSSTYCAPEWPYPTNRMGYPGSSSKYSEQVFPPLAQVPHPTATQDQWNQRFYSAQATPQYPVCPMSNVPPIPQQQIANQPNYGWQGDPRQCLPTNSQETSQVITMPSNSKRSSIGAHRSHPFLTPESSGYSSMVNSGMNTPIGKRSRSLSVYVEDTEVQKTKDDIRKEKNNLCDKRRRTRDNEEFATLEKENSVLKPNKQDEDEKIKKRRDQNKLAKQKSRDRKKENLKHVREENVFLKQEKERLEQENRVLKQEKVLFLAQIQELTKQLENRRIEELHQNLNEAAEVTAKHGNLVRNLMNQVSAELAKEYEE